MTKRGHRLGKGLFVSMLLTLTIALGGCAGDKEDGSSEQIAATQTESGSHITIGIAQDMNTMVPATVNGAGTKEILFNIYEGLYKPDNEGNLIPAVASDYTKSEDGLTYTFTLRDGVLFHNGNPVTVEDIKYSIDKCAGTETGEPLLSAFSIVKNVEIVDDKTVAIHLYDVDPDFLAKMATVEASIVPADIEDLEKEPTGTGPYMFVSRSLQENLVLKKFDAYWGTPANIENVTCKVLADPDSIVMNLEGGAVDFVARVTSLQANELSDKFYIDEGTMNLVQALFLNNGVKPFDDVRVRQALCYAVNKQEIMDFVSDGKGTPIASNIYPAFGKYYMDELNDVYTQNIEKAKELLAEAGYADGFSFKITVPSNYQQHIDTATVLAEQFKAIGVNAQIELIEWESWLSDVYKERNYEATVVGLDASTLTAGALLSRFRSDSTSNFCNYSNAEYDTAYQNALSAPDDETATAYYKECERILCEDAANVYIQDMVQFTAINKKYTGYVAYPMYLLDIARLDYAK